MHVQMGWELVGGGGGSRCWDCVSVLHCCRYCRIVLLMMLADFKISVWLGIDMVKSLVPH